MDKVNQWISHIQWAYNEDELKEEADAINRPITKDKFRKYFHTKDESTELLLLGWHIGHYKLIIDDNNLVALMTAILNIGLNSGTNMDCWKQNLSVMLEKDPCQPKLDHLCIIRLFEED